ncbi:MAG: molybdate ABC transporter permease subunit [Acidobacteria bacterium]|nr:molybdate ABC transporter permease subunit [Acidobacteriota bacterium]MXZ70136.1 molybdate ABC transporter permease subunit [Acidobacteriota bacterium]MYD72047.1 molybdate ABC transporter permease subunit [Acidobacteriota bacterium]MYJ03093.1 molybdate ABC transporter permease subunit [Acidobacteriota bacterium]
MAELIEVTGFTLLMAAVATLLMLPPGIAIAWVLARRRFWGRSVLETLVSLPLVVPPVATGLLLLKLFGRRGPIGALLEPLGLEIVFTWRGVVIAMAVMGLPLLIRAARAGFEQADRRYEEVAATLGAKPWRVFRTISLPLARRALLAGTVLGFSRAIGEFGATIMLAGALPGARTLSVAIYRNAELGRDTAAMVLIGAAVAIGFAAVHLSNRLGAAS